MKYDFILMNPPYGKIGCDITKFILKEIPYNDISLLGTTAMLSKYNDCLALEYVYIENYTLSPTTKCKWVAQLILLGHKGKCDVVPSKAYNGRKQEKPNEVRIPFSGTAKGFVMERSKIITTRNRDTSIILSLSDEDYEYIKKHWEDMSYVERFWWLVDRGMYRKYVVQPDNQ